MKYNTLWALIHSLLLGVQFHLLWVGFPINKTVRILSFYTNFNHLLVTIYFLWHAYIAMFTQNKYSKAFLQYTQFVIVSSIFVALTFWIGYQIDARMFLGRNPPSWYLLYFFHGGTAMLIVIEYCCLEDRLQYLRDGGQWHIISLIVYYLIVGVNYINSGRFPYPFQKRLNFWFNISGMLIIAAIVYLFYQRALTSLADRINLEIEERKNNEIKKEEKKRKAAEIEAAKLAEIKKEEKKLAKNKKN